jgi:hypothetical protein
MLLDRTDVQMDVLDKNHDVLVSRVKDIKDNMQAAKTNIDVLRIEMLRCRWTTPIFISRR